MRLSALNIFRSYKERRAQQEKKVKEASKKREKKIWDTREHKMWGDCIQLLDWDTRRWNGWTELHPRVGDEFLAPMASGKVGRFKVIKVDPCINPSDMWFATTKDLGYVGE